MKLVRFGARGRERPGVFDDSGPAPRIIDVSALVADYDEKFFDQAGVEWLREQLSKSRVRERLPITDAATTRLGPPIARPSKIIAVGVNYKSHGDETGTKPPDSPLLFGKATTAIVGPTDDIEIPHGETTVDWEVELAVVIGKRLKNANADECRAAVAGYMVMNDVTERTVQLAEMKQWFRGKSFDTFAPLGPWLVPAADVADPQDLDLSLTVNGERMQSSNTKNMIFAVGAILEKASRGMTLLPGDLISTGTPDGVGKGRNPPVYLKAGDVVEAAVELLGAQRCRVVAAEG